MAKKKKELSDVELDELDGYLQTEFNHSIYYDLTSKDNYDCDDKYALGFFRLLHSQIAFVEENKHKPKFIVRQLKKLVPDEWELHYLCKKISSYFYQTKIKAKDEQIKVCCAELDIIVDAYDDKIWNLIYEKKQSAFESVLAHLETLPDEPSRIKHLERLWTEYVADQSDLMLAVDMQDSLSYPSQLQKEIQKRKMLLELEQESQTETETETREIPTNPKDRKDLNLRIAVLFFYYLFKRAQVNADNTLKGEVIDYFVGYSSKTSGQQFSKLHELADSNFEKYKQEMLIVRKQFEKLGLKDAMREIDEELKFQEKQTAKNL